MPVPPDSEPTVAPSATPLSHGDARFRALVERVRDYAIVLLDPDGIIQSWNQGVEAIVGYAADEVIGKPATIFYDDEAVQRGAPAYELRTAREDGGYEEEGWRLRRNGTRFWANVTITPLQDEQGRHAGFVAIMRDLTARRDQERLLRESEERFRLLVSGVKDYAIFMLNPNGEVASWNAGAQAIKGYTANEILGRHFSVFYPPEVIARHWPEHELQVARETGRFEDEALRVRKDGTTFWANVVITALRDSHGELRGFAKVTRDMTTMKRVEELQDNERRMSEFLAMLGHELRNPLSPLQSALDILELKPKDERAIEWTRKVFGRQVRQLARLVDDLLDIGRITSGKVQLRFAPIDFGELVEETVEGMRPQLEARSQSLTVTIPPEPVIVRGDATHLAQIVTNLVGNACKYTHEHGRIQVSIEVDAGFVTLRVADNGIGLAPELVPRMFELFVQGNRALDRKEGGLGIGLTLVKRLAEMHGGTVAGSSPGINQGSQFTVRLPVMTNAQVREAHQGHGGDADAHYRVMVIDDNADVANSLAMLLQTLGHEVEVAGDGVTALARAPLFAPDLVLLDIGLPRMSGFDVARVMRTLPALANTTIVACTGYGQDDDRRRVREAGFDQHLVKPVRIEDLRAIFERMAPPAESAAATGTG